MKTIEKFHLRVADWSTEFFELETDDNVKMKHSFDYKDKTLIFSVGILNRKMVWTKGCTNKTIDLRFIPFFDYDNMRLSYVKEELKVLQEQFDLGDLPIFKSSKNSYQAVGFSKLSLNEFQNVLMHSSCDYAYIQFPKYLPFAKSYVLRQFSKGNTKRPEFVCNLERKTEREQSTAHHKYFKILYPNIKTELTKPDGLQRLTMVDYPTGTNI